MPVNMVKGEALKDIPDSLQEPRAKHNQCKLCGSSEHRWVYYKEAIKFLSSTKKKDKKPKKKNSTAKVTTSSSNINPRSLADRIRKPAAATSCGVHYDVDFDSLEIEKLNALLLSFLFSRQYQSFLVDFEVQTPVVAAFLGTDIHISFGFLFGSCQCGH
jgi:hypothetical protein